MDSVRQMCIGDALGWVKIAPDYRVDLRKLRSTGHSKVVPVTKKIRKALGWSETELIRLYAVNGMLLVVPVRFSDRVLLEDRE